MAGVGLRFLFVVLLLLHVAAFGAPAPSGTGEAHEEKPPAKDDSASKPSLDSSTLIRSSESMQPQSGAASLDSPPKSDHTGAKESKKAKNLDLPASNSLVSNPDPNDPKQSVNLQTKSKSADVLDSSPQKSDPEDIENLPPATESSQPHTSVSDSSAHKPDLNEAKQSGSLPLGSKGVQSVASVPDSTSRQSNPKENKETKNLSPSTENDHSGATVPESSPQNSDHNKANQNEKLPEESKTVQSDVDPSSRKADHNEDNQSENVPKKSKNPQSEVSVAEPPFPKSGQASQNEKNPHSGAAGAEPTPPKSDHNEANEKDNVPAVAENSIPDNSVPKDDDVDDDSMVDDETIGGGKEGEETAETSQSDKEEAKNSPVGPSPKNGSENSHFFAYLVTTAIVVAALYIAYHNKRKIIAFALEGKKSKVIRRPKSSDYQRLDQKI